MSLTLRAAIGLTAGLIAGIAVSLSDNTALFAIISLVEPIGAVWINGLQMTVIPLVVSLLITGVGSSANAAAIGRVGLKTLVVFLVLLFAAATFAALATPPLLSWLPVDSATGTSLRTNMSAVAETVKDLPTVGQWLINLIPVNPIRAATDGAMLPLIVFTLLFGFALTRITPDLRQIVLSFFLGMGEAMLVIVRWVLLLAPVGILLLCFPFPQRWGSGPQEPSPTTSCCPPRSRLSSCCVSIPWRSFWEAFHSVGSFGRPYPAQAVAFSSQSSLASLPAMIEGAEGRLGLPPRITSFVLPLAVAIFRLSSPVRMTVGALFIAHLYGIHLGGMQIATVALTSVLVGIGGVGLPGGANFFASFVPVFLAAGLPIEGVGILLAVDTIPDMFQTVNNVTADVAATTIVARSRETHLPVVESVEYEGEHDSVGDAMPS